MFFLPTANQSLGTPHIPTSITLGMFILWRSQESSQKFETWTSLGCRAIQRDQFPSTHWVWVMQLLNESDVFSTGDFTLQKKWRKRSYPQNHEIQCKIGQAMKSCFHWRLHFHDGWSTLVCNCWCLRQAIKNQSLNHTSCRWHFFFGMVRLLWWICCPVKFDAEQSTCTRLGDCTSMHNLPIFGTTKSCGKLKIRRGTKFGTPREKVAPAGYATRMGLHKQKFPKGIVNTCLSLSK